jgi:hypothetical protein
MNPADPFSRPDASRSDASGLENVDWVDPWPARLELLGLALVAVTLLVLADSIFRALSLTGTAGAPLGAPTNVPLHEELLTVSGGLVSQGGLPLVLAVVALLFAEITAGQPPWPRSRWSSAGLAVAVALGLLVAASGGYVAFVAFRHSHTPASFQGYNDIAQGLRACGGLLLGLAAAFLAERALEDSSTREAFWRPDASRSDASGLENAEGG